MDLLDKKKSRKKVKKSVAELNEESSVSAASSSGLKSKGEQDWLKEEDVELICRIKEVLPDNDQRSYESRANKIIWENVCFGEKSAEECKNRWDFIVERQRHFRTLSEVTDDALKWTDYRWYSFYGGENQKPPDDYPKQSLTSYNVFMNEKKEGIMLQNPHMTSKEISSIAGKMFRALNEKKKKKYVELARENYKRQLQEYNDTHTSVKLPGKMEPPQAPTPFKLFSANHATLASSAFKALNDEERLKWIDMALAQETNYLKKFEQFKVENPKLKPKLIPILNEEERLLVQARYGNKPNKPPTSGFKLFASEFPSVSSKKDRLTDWSASWRALSKKEKKVYQQRVIAMKHDYNTKLSSYLSKLPAERMHQEVVNLLPDTVGMKRKKTTESNASNSAKKAKFDIGNPSQPDPNGSDSSSSTSSDDQPVEIGRTSSSSSKSGKKVASSVIERCTIQREEDTSSDEEESSDSSEEKSTESSKKSSAMASSSLTSVRPIWASQRKFYKNEPPKPPKTAAEWHAFEIFKVSKIPEKKKKDLWNGLSEKKRRKLEREHTKRLDEYEEKLQAFKKGLSKTELLAFEHVKRSESPVSDDESE